MFFFAEVCVRTGMRDKAEGLLARLSLRRGQFVSWGVFGLIQFGTFACACGTA